MGPRKRAKKPEDEAEVLAAGEPAMLDESEETAAPTLEEVIETLSAELETLEDRHLRVVAEFDNFRKRTVKERAEQSQRAQADLARQLLESLDDLARVSELGSSDHDAAAILEGVQLVERKLQRSLEQLGLKRIEAVGQRFPEEDETVSQEFAKGYTFGNSLLRPSKVEVKMYRPAEEGSGGEPEETEDGS
jgi:molecular chaperone GrpE